MVQETLALIDTWYNEPSVGPERPKLLSKLALLELCGWLEVEMDRIILAVQGTSLNDAQWVSRDLIEPTSGFKYLQHFRPMLVKLLGEHLTRKIEEEMAISHPGDIDRLVTYTGDLWEKRCGFAHANMLNNVVMQKRFDAPSWSINQYRIIKKILSNIEPIAIDIGKSIL